MSVDAFGVSPASAERTPLLREPRDRAVDRWRWGRAVSAAAAALVVATCGVAVTLRPDAFGMAPSPKQVALPTGPVTFTLDTSCVSPAYRAANAAFFSSPIAEARVVYHSLGKARSSDWFAWERGIVMDPIGSGQYYVTTDKVNWEYGFALKNQAGAILYEIGRKNSAAGLMKRAPPKAVKHIGGSDCFQRYGKYFNRVRTIDANIERPSYAWGECRAQCPPPPPPSPPAPFPSPPPPPSPPAPSPPPATVVAGTASVPNTLPAEAPDASLAENECWSEGILGTWGAGRLYHVWLNRGAGKVAPTWGATPRIFFYVEDLTPSNATHNSSLIWSEFHLRKQDNSRKWDMSTCAPALNVNEADIAQGGATDCGKILLEGFNVMKDSATCHDPLAVSQREPYPDQYFGGLTAPGGWIMGTQKASASILDAVHAYTKQESYTLVGNLRKFGPSRIVVAIENPGYSFAQNDYGYVCSTNNDKFWRKREPFALSARIELNMSPGNDGSTVDKRFSTSQGAIYFTNHLTNTQVVYTGENFTSIMQQSEYSNNVLPIIMQYQKKQGGCNLSPIDTRAQNPVPDDFWEP